MTMSISRALTPTSFRLLVSLLPFKWWVSLSWSVLLLPAPVSTSMFKSGVWMIILFIPNLIRFLRSGFI